MNLLIDTNVYLEILLEQERKEESIILLSKVAEHQFFVSDYALHSIGNILFRRNRHIQFAQFLNDVVLRISTRILSLSENDLGTLGEIARKFGLDFDDAYQYAVAQKWHLTLITFDADFSRTDIGAKQPSQL